VDYSAPLSALRRLTTEPLQVRGAEGGWSQVVARRGQETVTLNSLVKGAPQDKFSNIILGAYNEVRKAQRVDAELKSQLGKRILGTQFLIAMIAEPILGEFAADCITEVSASLEGFVYNAEDFMTPDGEVILEAN
jgi:hypothetical protein